MSPVLQAGTAGYELSTSSPIPACSTAIFNLDPLIMLHRVLFYPQGQGRFQLAQRAEGDPKNDFLGFVDAASVGAS